MQTVQIQIYNSTEHCWMTDKRIIAHYEGEQILQRHGHRFESAKL